MRPAPSTSRDAPKTVATPSSSPPRSQRRWHRSPRSTARRTASRCTAVSASPGSTTPTSTTAARWCWQPASAGSATTRSRSSTSPPRPACAASNIDLDPDTEKLRDEIRAEVAALKAIPREQRNTAIAEGGWVQPHLPKPWGRASNPIEQIIIAQEFSAGQVQRPADGHRRLDHPVDRRVRHRRAEAAVPAADVPRRDDLVPAVFRAGRRLRPGEPVHQGHQGRRRLAHHRPEDLDHRRAVLRSGVRCWLAPTRALRSTTASPTSCST